MSKLQKEILSNKDSVFNFLDNSEFYDDYSVWSSLTGNELLDIIPLKNKAFILDIGTGTGFPVIELAKRFKKNNKFFAIDKWDKVIEIAEKKSIIKSLKNITFLVGDFRILSFCHNFDLIISNNGFSSSKYRKDILKKCYILLNNNGELYFSAISPNSFKEFYFANYKCLQKIGIKKEQIDKLNQKKNNLRKDGNYYKKVLENIGFVDIKIKKKRKILRVANLNSLLNYTPLNLFIFKEWKEDIIQITGDKYKIFFNYLNSFINKQIKKEKSFINTIEFNIISARKK